ncbi:uncharacterized protein [Procambarus clarkii]|uniref:uncharacterized protein isoform X2 n=1 Tax=Procambarus clarkii TaxID=6728 RepID=UPI001E672E6E|nr:uncharacterized protein LOC123772102 isoform X2 [Procambarus clarkii]
MLALRAGQQLACYSCNAVFKDVLSAAEHTLECIEPSTPIKKPEFVAKEKCTPNKVKIPRPPRTWIREYEAILLKCMMEHVNVIGEAKAKVGKKPYTIVMEELAKELRVSIGEWVDRKSIIKKWLGLLRRVRNFDALQKGNQMLGYLHLDPPEFYGSIKEIDREIQKVKLRVQRERKQKKDKNEDTEETAPESTKNNSDKFGVKDCKVEADIEYIVEGGTHDRKCIEVVDVANTMMRKDIVISILNRLEQGIFTPGDIAQEFEIDEIFLELIKQRKEIIIQGIERCSLCHLLLINKKDLVSHELQCSAKNNWVKSCTDDRVDNDSFQFFPATVERLVQLVIETNPRENRRNTWKKIAFHLSGLQDGVTVKRCNQKWRNLVNQCRSYEQLDKWAIAHNYTHSRPMPEFYHLIMPYVSASEGKRARPSLDEIRKFISTSKGVGRDDDGSWDESNNFNDGGDEDNDESPGDYEDPDLNDSCDHLDEASKSKSTPEPPNDEVSNVKMPSQSHTLSDPPNDVVTTVKLPTRSKSVSDSPSKQCTGESSKVTKPKVSDPGDNKAQETIKNQAELITKFGTKLDNALVLLRDMARENQRLCKVADTKSNSSMANVVEKICKVIQMQLEMQNQMMKRFDIMTNMWERHHQENLDVMKTLIVEISPKAASKLYVKKSTEQTANLNQSNNSTTVKSKQVYVQEGSEPDQTYNSKGMKPSQTYKRSIKPKQTGKSIKTDTTKLHQTCSSKQTETNRQCIIMTRKRGRPGSSDSAKVDNISNTQTTKLDGTCNSVTKTSQESDSKTGKSEDEMPNKRIKKKKVIYDY